MSKRASPEVPEPAPTLAWWKRAAVSIIAVFVLSFALPNPPPAIVNGFVKPTPLSSDWILWVNSEFRNITFPFKAYPSQTIDFNPVRYTMNGSGLWQYWDMFAPDPFSVEHYVDAEVTYADGSTRQITLHRQSQTPLFTRYLTERYRKYFERAPFDNNTHQWPYLARAVAYQADDRPDNPPVEVRLFRNIKNIQPPDQPQPTEYSRFHFYTYLVTREDARRKWGRK